MRCPKCESDNIFEDLSEDTPMSRAHKMGRVWYCFKCGYRIYEYVAALPVKLAMHEPRHRSLGI